MEVRIDHKTLTPSPGASLFDCAEQMDVRIPTSCFKNGKCRECLVEVVRGAEHLSPPAPEEKHLRPPYRLSCRAHPQAGTGPAAVIECRTLRRSAMRIEQSGTTPSSLTPHPAPPDPAVTRRGSQILLDGEPIAESTLPLHGIAIDLGTTTVVARLVDLETGQTVQTAAFENPQRFGGSDIMARIQYDTENPGLLRRTLLGHLSHTIGEFDCDPLSIFEIVIAGNSTMRDLLFGLDVSSIGQRPYRSITEHELRSGQRPHTALSTSPRKLHLPIHPHGRVYGLPLISGHVGADAAACLLAINLAGEDRFVALMDIGTNTELTLGNRHQLFVASCPAGPAFEGGLISCGMPGLPGAIESFHFDDQGSPSHRVIGNQEPEGICGSGLVELLSELHRTGRMDHLGRLTDESDRYHVDRHRHIALTEEDISQLAQAKGANAAGIRILFKTADIGFHQLDRFYLAGGFARHLPLDGARRIGLIPNLPDEKIVQLGNATVEGATIALLSASRRRQLESLVQQAVHVELETDEDFFDHFVEGCQFKPVEDPNQMETAL